MGESASDRAQEASGGGASTIVALLLDRTARARIVSAAGSAANVHFCERALDLVERVSTGRTELLITECRDRNGVSTLPAVEVVRQGYPSLPVIVFAIPGRTPSADILAMAKLGVHELVMHGFDDVGIMLNRSVCFQG